MSFITFLKTSPRAACVVVSILLLATFSPLQALAQVDSDIRVVVRLEPGFGSGPLAESAFLTGEGFVRQRGGRIHHRFPALGAFAATMDRATAGVLAMQPGVAGIEPDLIRTTSSLKAKQLVPSLGNGLYGLVTSRFVEAHKKKADGKGVLVGVADSGLDCQHPDIAPAFVGGMNAVGIGGPSPCLGQPGIAFEESHGTHVAGTVVAANNKTGVVGGAPLAKLVHARVCSGASPGRCFMSDVMEGVQWLADAGARVINLSLGGEGSSILEEQFFRTMRERGVLVVAASGNESAEQISFPAGYPGVVSVGAVDAFDQRASFSNAGPELDLVAPGVSVLSTVPRSTGSESGVIATAKIQFAGIGMTFAANTAPKGVAKKLIPGGLGRLDEIPNTVKGQIALLERGELLFAEKVANAMAKGAIAVIVYNREPGVFAGTLGEPVSPSGTPWIPTIGVSQEAGAWLLAKRKNKAATLLNALSDWALNSGTSMAAPHVTAAAALVFGTRPDLGADAVEQRLKDTAQDLGEPGPDPNFGFGRVDAFRAALE